MAALTRYFPAVLSGILLTLAFPSPALSWLAFAAFVPLLVSIAGKGAKTRFTAGLAAGLSHYLTLLYWLIPTLKIYGELNIVVAGAILCLLSFYLALYMALFSTVCGSFRYDSLFMPLKAAALFVSLEYLRGFLLSGFPWGIAGYTQYLNLPLIQIADITGVYGVSFVIMTINACAAGVRVTLGKRKRRLSQAGRSVFIPVLCTLVIVAAVFAYGHTRPDRTALQDASKNAGIAVVQGNIAQDRKWNDGFVDETVRRYCALSLKAARKNPHLIVWPETALPFYYGTDYALSRKVDDCIRKCRTDFLIGSPAFERDPDGIRYYNRAYMINRFGVVTGQYDKIHLVPFGEYVPFGRYLSFLGKMTAQAGDFSPGKPDAVPLAFQKGSAGVLICFEIIFPALSRNVVRNGADILITITNDAWFGYSSAPEQHFAMAVFRAVENRRSIVRAANTGISGFITPDGKVVKRSGLYRKTVLFSKVPAVEYRTVYTLYGDIFSQLCLLAIAAGFVIKTVSRRRKTDVLKT